MRVDPVGSVRNSHSVCDQVNAKPAGLSCSNDTLEDGDDIWTSCFGTILYPLYYLLSMIGLYEFPSETVEPPPPKQNEPLPPPIVVTLDDLDHNQTSTKTLKEAFTEISTHDVQMYNLQMTVWGLTAQDVKEFIDSHNKAPEFYNQMIHYLTWRAETWDELTQEERDNAKAILAMLTEAGGDINAQQGNQRPLIRAIQKKNTEWTRELVEQGADVNSPHSGEPPLVIAHKLELTSIQEILLHAILHATDDTLKPILLHHGMTYFRITLTLSDDLATLCLKKINTLMSDRDIIEMMVHQMGVIHKLSDHFVKNINQLPKSVKLKLLNKMGITSKRKLKSYNKNFTKEFEERLRAKINELDPEAQKEITDRERTIFKRRIIEELLTESEMKELLKGESEELLADLNLFSGFFTTVEGLAPMQYAAHKGMENTIEQLITCGVDVNDRSMTPVFPDSYSGDVILLSRYPRWLAAENSEIDPDIANRIDKLLRDKLAFLLSPGR